jgi:hypothetical protein
MKQVATLCRDKRVLFCSGKKINFLPGKLLVRHLESGQNKTSVRLHFVGTSSEPVSAAVVTKNDDSVAVFRPPNANSLKRHVNRAICYFAGKSFTATSSTSFPRPGRVAK